MKTKRIIIVFSGLIVFLVLLVILNLQVIFNRLLSKEHIEEALAGLFGHEVILEAVEFNIWRGVEISGLRLLDSGGDKDLLAIEKIRISYRKSSLLEKELVPGTIEIVAPKLALSGKDSLAKLIPKIKPGSLGVSLPKVKITRGHIVFDYPEVFQQGYLFSLSDVNLTLYPYAPRRYVIEGSADAGLMGRWVVKGEIDMDSQLIKITFSAHHINLSDPLAAKLSDKLQQIWGRYQPRGLTNLKIELIHNPANHPSFSFNVQAECLGNEMTFIGLPYKLRNVTGDIVFYPDGARMRNLISKNGVTVVKLEGMTEGYKRDAGFKIKVDIEKLLMNADLYEALNQKLKDMWVRIQPEGFVDVYCEVTREQGNRQSINYQARISCRDCRITHKDFPYQLTELKGDVEYNNGSIRLKSVVGRHDKAHITINGKIDNQPNGTGVDIVIEAKNVETSDYALKEAFNTLVTNGAQLWETYQPAGLIDLVLTLKQTAETGLTVKPHVKIDCKGNSVKYGKARYPLSEITGQIEYENSKVSLKQLKATSIRPSTTDTKPSSSRFEINGEVYLDSQQRVITQPQRYKIEIKGTDLIIDQALKKLLPESFKSIMTELNPTGLVDIVLKLSSVNTATGDKPRGFDYFAEVELNDGAFKPGIDLTEINGRITIKGAVSVITRNSYASGSLKLDQLRIEGHLLENVSIQFTQEGPNFSFYNIKGAVYHGASTGFLTVVSPGFSYSGQLSLGGIDLKELGRDLGTYNVGVGKVISGKLAMDIEFKGESKDPKSIQAKGRFHITDAQLWDVPIFLSVLNAFSLKKSVFREGEVKFKIVDGKIIVRQLTFTSDAVILKGRGTIGLDDTLDLELAIKFVGMPIPLIDRLRNLFTKGIASIKVEGTFNQPRILIKPLPILDIFK